MFRRSRSQSSLLESHFLLPKERRERLERSWSQIFKTKVLPLIDEEPFRKYFDDDNGRPNKSIRLLVALHLLKEAGDLTDEQMIEQLLFNLQWHHALGLEATEATVCQKTLHNFRVLLVRENLLGTVFYPTVRKIVAMEQLSVVFQRQDSTQVVSDIAQLTRLGLFVETVTCFLKELRREAPRTLKQVPAICLERYLEREGYFSDVKREEAKRRLPLVAQDLFDLVKRFEGVRKVSTLSTFRLMERLLHEQCIVEPAARPEEQVTVRPTTATPEDAAADASARKAAEAEVASPEEQVTVRLTTATPEDAAADASARRAAEADAARPEEQVTVRPTTATPGDAAADASARKAAEAEAASPSPTGPGQEAPSGEAKVALREPSDLSSASLQTPHDPEVSYGHKGQGYSVQVVETCDKNNPFQAITHVEVNGAHVSDQTVVIRTMERLEEEGLKPAKVFADTGYGSGENIVACAKRGVDLQAPVRDPHKGEASDPRWREPGAPAPSAIESQAAPSLADFTFTPDYLAVLACPAGRAPDRQSGIFCIVAQFDAGTCAGCSMAGRCPARGVRGGGHRLKYRPAEAATAARQVCQKTKEFKEGYKVRSGIEATNSQLKGPCGARELRVRGRDRVALVMTIKALARNVFRMVDYNLDKLRRGLPVAAEEAC